MKKIITSLVAVALLSFVAFAEDGEGLSVKGYLRAGMTDTTEGSVYTTDTWMHGGYFGGKTRLRVNVDYTKAFGGLTFRYQQTEHLTDFFNNDNLKWAMGYANLLDGQVIAEAGFLSDRFTKTGGWEDEGIGHGRGFRLVLAPQAVSGLTLVAQASDKYADKYTATDSKVEDGKAKAGDVKFDKKVLGFSAKYDHELFFVTGGAALAGYYYGSVGLKAVENLTLVGEVFHDATDDTKAKNGDKAKTMIVAWVEYKGIDRLLVGAYSYINLCDGKHSTEITPAVAYGLTDLFTLSVESSIYLSSKEGAKTYATISPGVTFKASDKATATASGLISTDKDQAKHAFTAGVRYNF